MATDVLATHEHLETDLLVALAHSRARALEATDGLVRAEEGVLLALQPVNRLKALKPSNSWVAQLEDMAARVEKQHNVWRAANAELTRFRLDASASMGAGTQRAVEGRGGALAAERLEAREADAKSVLRNLEKEVDHILLLLARWQDILVEVRACYQH